MQDFRDVLSKKIKVNPILREGIVIGDYVLSIQASNFHKCEPAKSNLDLYDYKEMELCIYKNHKAVNVLEDKFFNNWKDKKELDEHYDLDFYIYVPINLIQSLYEYILSSYEIEW